MNKFSDNDLDILVEIQTAVLEKNFNKMYETIPAERVKNEIEKMCKV